MCIPNISTYLSERLRSTIGHQVLFGEYWSAVHEHHELQDALIWFRSRTAAAKCAHQIDATARAASFPCAVVRFAPSWPTQGLPSFFAI